MLAIGRWRAHLKLSADEVGKKDKVRLMADLLRSGATLTDLSCPVCASPIFRLKSGELWCAQCQKKVVVIKEEEEAREIEISSALSQAESVLLTKVWEINEKLKIEENLEEIQRLSLVMSTLLDNLERIRRIGKTKK
ncbi:MAG: Sjogren's syndrome/scleroderma autoantigen 1 family protein [Candidatus Bathyarchaeia archaeon]